MKILQQNYLVQQESAFDESYRLTEALMKTGKTMLVIPPDCFIWTGTKEELVAFLELRQKPK